MDAARKAVTSFIGRDGTHETDVNETVNAPVTSETIKPHRHEETTEAVDREVHQDHYHTTVQPVAHRETLPEQHVHNLAPQIEKTIEHGSREQDSARVASELGQFRDTSTTAQTTQSTGVAAAVTGEHVHHHVHEVVQPVIHKETIQPEFVHTTVPIHEKHIAPSEHHGLSTLPVRTLDDFSKTGASLTGGTHSREEYDGHPRSYDPALQVERTPVDLNPSAHEGMHDPEKTGHYSRPGSSSHHNDTSSGTGAAGVGTGFGSSQDGSGQFYSSGFHHDTSSGTGAAGVGTGAALAGAGSHGEGYGTSTSTGTGIGGTDSTLSGRETAHDYTTSGGNTSGHNTSTGVGSGVAGVAAGGAARDLGHSTHTGDREVSHHESPSENSGSTQLGYKPEPTNLGSGRAGSSSKHISDDDNVQHASKIGEDPSLTKDRGGNTGKLTGTGIDGSHSAVFGLTPDGHKHEDTKHGMDEAALSHEEKKESKKDHVTVGDTNERAPEAGKVADQMQDPRVAEKGHGGSAEYQQGDNSKPGAGIPSV